MFGGGPGGPRQLLAQETSKPVNTSATLGRLLRLFGRFWPMLIAVAVLVVAGTYVQVLTPDLVGQSVDCYLTPATTSRFTSDLSGGKAQDALLGGAAAVGTARSASASNCWFATSTLGTGAIPPNSPAADYIAGLARLVLVLVVLYLLGSVMTGLQFYLMTWTGQHVLKGLRVSVFQHLHKLSLSYYAENEAGSVMSRVTNDIDTLQQAISFVLVSVASGLLLIVWIGIVMLRLSLPYALISMSVIPLMIVATWWFSNQARKAFRRTRVSIGNVNADLQQSIAGVREVQAFGREDANIESFRASNAANRDANVRAVGFTAALAPTLEALGYLAMAITTVVGGLLLLRGQSLFGTAISLGLVITFLQYVQRFNMPIQQISVLWANLQSAVAGAERIFALLDTAPAIQDKANAPEMPAIVGQVEFDHVDAAYKQEENVLCGVSFTAEPGQTIAVVGPTGAGKTTIINLIPRFYDVVGGAIRIDGHDVRDVTRASLRRQIGIVLQDTFLFSDTVMNNIRFGKPDATDEQVANAAMLARADEFIRRLPNGYDTMLGERGSGLSQGQRQLLAIARAALTDPRILILDEATSSVDTRTERQIQKALDELLRGRTSFVIAHRLSTIRNADQVLVLVDGEIVERGKHDELLDRRGAYYELYMKQFRREEQGMAKVGGNGQGATPFPAPAPA
ncbi:MAG: ABC transporter ATP-binding protein/permease [Anaerolineae bacterium]|jgi:ATP-binding cassette subfamily B protein|nr:ABC transporter ATP-binding protein/permease [Anaerolineae bacterium]